MGPPRIAVSIPSLRLPLRKALSAAASLGVTAVEIDARGELRPGEMTGTAVRHLRKTLGDFGLSVCSVRFFTRRGYNNPEALDRRIAATKDAMQMAYQLRAPVVVNRIGRVPEEAGGPGWDLLIGALHDLSQFGDRVGATLLARTGSEDGAALARLLDELPEQGIGVDFDPASLIINSFSPLESLQALGRYVRQFRARDAVRDLAQGRGVETSLGRGTADFPALLGLLEDYGYQGFFTIDREYSDDPRTDVANAAEYLRNIYR